MVGRDVFLELDCVMVIKMLKEKGTNRSLVAPIILDMDREKSCPKKVVVIVITSVLSISSSASPSVATLIRAACTCPAWRRAMSSSPDFRRRFRSLHPSPLLGLFTSDTSDASSIVAAFVPALPHGSRPDDDDLAAAVRGGDFSLPNAAGGGGGWRLATIFAMETGKVCSATPWVDIPACPDQVDGRVPVGGSAFSRTDPCTIFARNWGYIASIDTSTMGITVVELPPQCVSRGSLAKVGETKDGETCLSIRMGAMRCPESDAHEGDDVQKWVLDRVVSMDAELRRVLPAASLMLEFVC
ncbi:hypothetical protein HU200_010181 [Digitaria exilis]|uniref:Uncharacterized protein n=1 Tax=Digitaria exilis TaxID=1010633 RepID=A0A835FIK7_9POAL|nr:hypothetical protein HU200_010181 [Digitaria exilis]